MTAAQEDAALQRARAWLRDPPAPMPVWPTEPSEALQLGQALKVACYETWNTDPMLAERAAVLIEALVEARPLPALRPLAHWTRGIAQLAGGGMDDALCSLDAAAAAFDALDDVAHAAQTQVPKLMALSMLGRHEEALQCARTTLQRFVDSGDERSAGKIELNLGTMLFRQDRHVEAARHYRRAAQRFAQVADVEQSVMADIGLANALTWQFEFDEALRVNERARALADANGYAILSAQARGSIGQIELNRGHPQRALPALAEACRLLESSDGLPQRLAEAEISLADAYLAVHLLPEAVALYDRVIERCGARRIPVEEARARLQRAQALVRTGEFAAAEVDLQAARELFASQDNPASAALADLHRAALALRRGEADAARVAADVVAKAFASAAVPGWQCEAEVLAAEACAAAGSTDAARLRFEAALRSPGSATPTVVRCRLGLAALDAAAGDVAASRRRIEEVLTVLEFQHDAMPGDEFRIAFGADLARAGDALVALDWADVQASPMSLAASEALWQAIERQRGRALALGLTQSDARAGDATEALRTRLRWTRAQARLALADGNTVALTAFDDQARAVEATLLEAYRRDQTTAEASVGLSAPVPSLERLQSVLAVDEAWVQYHVLGEGWIAAVVTRAAVRWYHGSMAGLAERLDSLHFQLEAMRGASPALRVHEPQLVARTRVHLEALYRQLWQPLAEGVAGYRRLVVAPHRRLHYVPFAALHDGRSWLLDTREFSLAPSARIGILLRDRPSAPTWRRMLAVGAVQANLPHVAAEAQAVVRLFGPGSRLLLGATATRDALQASAAEADIVHIACHAQFRADSPYFSALHLADGELTLRDAAALPLAECGLVALSACETGLSRIAPGDEMVGLVRGFLRAGAPSVLATLWTVDDATTAGLMQDFYARLCEGSTPGEALRAAQSALARSGRHPFYWAAFVLHGRA